MRSILKRFMSGTQRRGLSAAAVMLVTLSITNLFGPGPAGAADWPTYMHDNNRSGITSEQLTFPLNAQWVYKAAQAPRPAWSDLKFDHTPIKPLRLMFDHAFHLAAADGALYFASSADNRVYCLDAATGKERWSFFTDGPVRFTPTVYERKVYAGSDDGYVYCLDAADGSLKWKVKPSPIDRLVIGNDAMISAWPIRTGVLVDQGIAYFCAGLFDSETEGVSICAVNADDGSKIYIEPVKISPQGHLLASATRLYVPLGAGLPAAFDRKNGKLLGKYMRSGSGGTYAMLYANKIVTSGFSYPRDLTIYDKETTEFDRLMVGKAQTVAGDRVIITKKLAYVLDSHYQSLTAVDLAQRRALQAQLKKTQKVMSSLHADEERWRHGRIKDWLVIGPFPIGVKKRTIEEPPGFRHVYPPETEINLTGKYDGKGGKKIGWQRASIHKHGSLNLTRLWKHTYWGIGYALTYVYSPEDRSNVKVIGGSTYGGMKVWVNDKQIYSVHAWRMYSGHDDDVFTVDLKAGWNKFLVKMEHANESWSLHLRFEEYQDLKTSTDKDDATPFLSDYDQEIVKLKQEKKEIRKQWDKERDALKNSAAWKHRPKSRDSLIMAGNTLFTGGENRVDAIDAGTGKQLWTGKVSGKAYALAVADGRLFVSTDKGEIHCFASAAVDQPSIWSAAIVPSPYPDDDLAQIYASAAETIIQETKIKRGYCLVLGSEEGRLAYELAKRTDLKIIGIEEDPAKIAAARSALTRAGLYGTRITVRRGSLTALPYPTYFANLIVSDRMLISGKIPGSAAEMFRVLRPSGGIAYLGRTAAAAKRGGNLKVADLKTWLDKSPARPLSIVRKNGLWAVVARGALEGARPWTHQYAEPGHTSCSNDQLARYPMGLLWFGEPGPSRMIDRHSRPPAPLSAGGRLFIQGRNRVMAFDAYNGTEHWDTPVNNALRVNVPSDTGNMVATADHVYIAVQDECRRLDADTGKVSLIYKVPKDTESTPRDWGYLSYTDQLLLGSSVKKKSFYTIADGRYYDAIKPLMAVPVTSDQLFALDRTTGKPHWTYKGSVIINSTIAAGGGLLYFVESRNPAAINNKKGRIRKEVFVDQHLVALDTRTGTRVWQRPVDFSKCNRSIFLSYANNTLIILGTSDKFYLYAFNATTGEPRWDTKYIGWRGGGHGGTMRHPVIVGDVLYARPRVFNLKTGEQLPGIYWGNGCGAITASATCFFFRDNTTGILDLTTNKNHIWNPVRPGCWINMIPAGGIMMSAEGSSGCKCSFAIRTSFALGPIAANGELLRGE